MNLYLYCALCFGFTSFLIGLLIWIKLANRIGFLYFFFSGAAGLWGMFSIFFSNNLDYETSLFFSRCSNAAALFIGPGWYHFALVFSNRDQLKSSKIILGFFYLATVVLLMFSFSRWFVPNVAEIVDFKYFTKPGPLYIFFTLLFFTSVPLGFFELFRYRRGLSGNAKAQCLGLILATGAGFIGGSLTFAPVYDIPLPQYGMFLMPLYPLFMAISMMKYGLLTEENLVLAAHKDKLAALGILTASINHEIRAPLFVIRGTVETETDSSKIKERVIGQVDRLAGIVSRLTHFAKKGVEEEATIEAIDLKEVLADIRPLFQHQLNYQSIEYTQDISADLPKVMADRRYLEEILFNLILNACQALKNTEKPQIKLSACVFKDHRQQTTDNRLSNLSSPSSRGSSPSGSRKSSIVSPSSITIVIEDNGPGIAPDQLKNIFKPFHTTKQEGTGLGLYITKQLVEKCGGKIEIDSTLGEGAKFTILFKGDSVYGR